MPLVQHVSGEAQLAVAISVIKDVMLGAGTAHVVAYAVEEKDGGGILNVAARRDHVDQNTNGDVAKVVRNVEVQALARANDRTIARDVLPDGFVRDVDEMCLVVAGARRLGVLVAFSSKIPRCLLADLEPGSGILR